MSDIRIRINIDIDITRRKGQQKAPQRPQNRSGARRTASRRTDSVNLTEMGRSWVRAVRAGRYEPITKEIPFACEACQNPFDTSLDVWTDGNEYLCGKCFQKKSEK